MFTKFLVIAIPQLGGLLFKQFLDLLGRCGLVPQITLRLFPGHKRQTRILGRVVDRNHSGFIPIRRPVKLSESHAGNFRSRRQTQFGSSHFESYPLTRLGQPAHLYLFRGVLGTIADSIFIAPIGTVAPVIGTKLQHNGLGRILRVEVDISEELSVRADS